MTAETSWTEPLRELVAGRILFPAASELLNRRGIMFAYGLLRRCEELSAEELRELQTRRLRRVVAYAMDEVPFYARRFREAGIERGDVDALEDPSPLPILEREDVVEHAHELVARRFASSIAEADTSAYRNGQPIPFARFRRHRLVRNSTTGSTGTPLRFYDDGTVAALSWAHELRVKSWFGVRPGAREVRMERIAAEGYAGGRSVRLRRALLGQLVLPGLNLAPSDHRVCLDEIVRFRPRVLWGVTTALTGLAEFAREAGRERPVDGLRLVIARAAPLYEPDRSLLEEVFRASVTSLYGTREVGHVAATCPAGAFHVNQESYVVESLAAAGEPAELLVTMLQPAPMPFIRYRVGDVGALGGASCACGRTLQVLADLVGRAGDVFVTVDGRRIDPNSWLRIMRSDEPDRAVGQFQVVYESAQTARLRIVPRRSYSSETEAAIRRAVERTIGPSLRLRFEYLEAIPPAAGGKVPVVVNRAASRDRAAAEV